MRRREKTPQHEERFHKRPLDKEILTYPKEDEKMRFREMGGGVTCEKGLIREKRRLGKEYLSTVEWRSPGNKTGGPLTAEKNFKRDH